MDVGFFLNKESIVMYRFWWWKRILEGKFSRSRDCGPPNDRPEERSGMGQ